MAALGCFGIGAAQTAFTFGISLTSAASTGLVFTTAPVWGMVLGFVLGLERPSWRGVVGVGSAFWESESFSTGGCRAWRTACWVTS
jgi:drug/metabolite transporter (DMT)-like permease